MDKIWTIIDLLNWGSDYFSQKGISSARLNIELLLCHVFNLKRIDLYTKFDRPASQEELDLLKSFIKRRVLGEPIQYILNNAQFLEFNLFVDKNVLIPRPETEELVQLVFNDFTDFNAELNILDIGTGSGCIAIALASKYPNSKITAIDISEDALKIAQKNLEKYNLCNVELKNINILTKIPKMNFDLIISNPPYISIEEYQLLEENVKEFEPKIALTDETEDGISFYKRIVDIMPHLGKNSFNLYFEIAFNQSEIVTKYMSDVSIYRSEIKIVKDFAQKDRFVKGKFVKMENN